MRFVSLAQAAETFRGKSVAIVGSGPSAALNRPGYVDSFDVVVRVNNHRCGPAQGVRTDVHYSFYGGSIKKSAAELKGEGVTLCMNKCPNSQPIESPWHVKNNRRNGIDFSYIYRLRKEWWFCDTYVPDDASFVRKFELLGNHIPTTGFAAILDVLDCKPGACYLTGFDFFQSRIHNVNEPWRPGDPSDPIGHRPDLEAKWLSANAKHYLMLLDPTIARVIAEHHVFERAA